MQPEKITVGVEINASIQKTWENFISPDAIKVWCVGTDTWHTPHAENDVRVGGVFLTRMEAKDQSFGFDLKGTYTEVIPNELIKYDLEDGRQVEVIFNHKDGVTSVIENFDPENENSRELQSQGWQGILDRLKIYVESN